jgi:hypothetical protein
MILQDGRHSSFTLNSRLLDEPPPVQIATDHELKP